MKLVKSFYVIGEVKVVKYYYFKSDCIWYECEPH